MDEELKRFRHQIQSMLRNRKEPVGFKCWDCEVEIVGLDITDEAYKNNPVSLTGYIMTICEECSQIED